ncbi:MAG: phosphatidate cytidylyltransferase [Gaiellaceae bacterium]
MSSLVNRIAVSIVALPLVLGLVYAGGWALLGLGLAVALVAVHEYAELVRPLRPLVLAAYLGVGAMLVGASLGGLQWLLGGFLATLLVAFVMQGLAGTSQPATVSVGSTMLGAAWIGLGIGHVLLLRDLEHGVLAIFTVLLAVFAADTFAFFGGRLVGRHRMAPVMSPRKTWEGFVTGTTAAVAVAFFAIYPDRDTFLNVWQSLVLGAVLALAAALGDLFESAIKRDMGAKDSGRLLGAHGGILDRLDGHLFAAPAAYYLIAGFGHA